MNVVPYNGANGNDPMQSIDNVMTLEFLQFDYNWTVAQQIAGIYYIQSKEKFEVADEGPFREVGSRYPIQSLSHRTSYILGYALGFSWEETSNMNYYNPGGYNAYLTVSGNLVGYGLHIALQPASRYVNAGIVFTYNGRFQ